MSERLALPRLLARDASNARSAASLLIALLGHGALVAFAFEQEAAPPALLAVTEVELAPREQPPPPLPEPEAPAPAAQPRAEHRPLVKRASSAPAPAAAAANLRTVEESVKSAREPVRFVTDPNGTAFGYGSVARGGTAASASGPVTPQPSAAPATQRGGTTQPLLSRPPSLSESEPCRGFFPARASADRGEVALRVRVDRDGSVRAVTVAREQPLGHGFGFAARDCLLSKRFSPALDQQGDAVAVVSPVLVRFAR